MSRLDHRAFALVLLALLAPLAGAQSGVPQAPVEPTGAPSTEPPEEPPAEPPPGVADCSAPVEDCFPDLIPSNPRAFTTDERFPTRLCTDFMNVGRGAVVSPFRVLLSVDGIPTADRQFSDQYQTGQGERDVCWENVPTVGGRHTVTIFVDSSDQVIETDEKNNERTVAFTVAFTPQVDLRIKSFEVLPREGGPRENQIFAVSVVNSGNRQSNSTTMELSDSNGPLATFQIPPLAPGDEHSVAYATRPELRPVGTFVARAVVDPLGNNTELSELNNDAFAEYTVLDHPAPDLVITNVETSGSRTEFRGLLVNVTVENLGDKSARRSLLRAINETGDVVGQTQTQSYLGPNATNTLQLRLVLRAGERELRLVLDPLNEVLERNETNNVHTLHVTIDPPAIVVDEPNLIVERVFAMPSDPRPGEIVSIGALVRNVGTNRSGIALLNFTIDGRPVGSTSIPALGAGLSHTGYVPWAGSTAGLHTITAIADGPNKIAELDEGDNALALEFVVGAIAPPEEDAPAPAPPPPVETPPTNVTPTAPPANTTRPSNGTSPAPITGPRVAIGDFILTPRAVPGGVKGIISVTLRNPNLEPVGLITVQFKVDGRLIKEVLVGGIPSAATRAATSQEVDLPGGKHVVSAEVRVVGSSEPSLVRDKEYDVAAGDKEGLPAPPAILVALLAAGIALVRRREVSR